MRFLIFSAEHLNSQIKMIVGCVLPRLSPKKGESVNWIRLQISQLADDLTQVEYFRLEQRGRTTSKSSGLMDQAVVLWFKEWHVYIYFYHVGMVYGNWWWKGDHHVEHIKHPVKSHESPTMKIPCFSRIDVSPWIVQGPEACAGLGCACPRRERAQDSAEDAGKIQELNSDEQCSKPLLVDDYMGLYSYYPLYFGDYKKQYGNPYKPTRIKWNDRGISNAAQMLVMVAPWETILNPMIQATCSLGSPISIET